MGAEEGIKSVILYASGILAAVAVTLGGVELRRRHWLEACTGPGVAIVILLVMEAVFGAPAIPLTWRSGLYVVGMILILLGLVGYMRGRR